MFPDVDIDYRDRARDGGDDPVQHLHRLMDEEELACLDVVAFLDLDFHDGAGEMGDDVAGVGLLPDGAVFIFLGQRSLVLACGNYEIDQFFLFFFHDKSLF